MKAKLFFAMSMMLVGAAMTPNQSQAASSGRVFYTSKGRAVYFGTWHFVRNSQSPTGYSVVVNSKYGSLYRLFPSRRSVGGHVQMSWLSYRGGKATGGGQAFLRTTTQGGYYTASLRSTHSRGRSGNWIQRTGQWYKMAFTIDR